MDPVSHGDVAVLECLNIVCVILSSPSLMVFLDVFAHVSHHPRTMSLRPLPLPLPLTPFSEHLECTS